MRMNGMRLRVRLRRLCAALMGLAIIASTGACSAFTPTGTQPDGPTIAVGVTADVPGLGFWHQGTYSGFDVDVATYVAQVLGYAKKQIRFEPVTPATISAKLNDGSIDMAVSALPLDVQARNAAQFAGPYLAAGQDLLIRKQDAGSIVAAASMSGRRVCVAKGSGAEVNLIALAPGVKVQQRDTYPQCVTALLVGEVDAVTADDAVLTGLASGKAAQYLTTVGRPFANVWHGVRVQRGDTELTEKITAALRGMIDGGDWRRAANAMRGVTGYTANASRNPPKLKTAAK